MAVEPGAAQSSSSGSTDTRVVSSGSRGMVWCGVCVVGQRMPRCCLSQVVYVRAVARVHALRGVVGWVGSSGGSGGVSAAPAGIHWPVECPLGGRSWGSACGSGAHPHTHVHTQARAWRRRARPPTHPHLPSHTPEPLPLSHVACCLHVRCGVWGWRVAYLLVAGA